MLHDNGVICYLIETKKIKQEKFDNVVMIGFQSVAIRRMAALSLSELSSRSEG